jgi:hypothetical protein
MATVFDSLLNDPEDQTQNAALVKALRNQQGLGILGMGMGLDATQQIGQGLYKGAQTSFSEAMDARQRAKQMKLQQSQMAAEAAQRAQQQQNWQANYAENQRQFGIEQGRLRDQAHRQYSVSVDPITGTMRMYNATTGEWKDAQGGTKPGDAPLDVFNVNVTGKPTTQMQNDLLGIRQQRGAIAGAIRAANANPKAFGFQQGAGDQFGGELGAAMANWVRDPQNSAARSFVLNNVSAIINERAGSAQSAQELSRLRGFLPSETDDVGKITAKFNAFLDYLDEKEAATRGYTTEQLGYKPRVGAPAQNAVPGAQTVDPAAPRPGDKYLPQE